MADKPAKEETAKSTGCGCGCVPPKDNKKK